MKGVIGRVLQGLFLAIGVAGAAHALPALQLYVEGGTYNATTQSWEVNFPEAGKIRLWTIGAVGEKGTIQDVRLSVVYPDGRAPTFFLAPSTTRDLRGFTDDSTPVAATLLQTQTDGAIVPQLGPMVDGVLTGGDLPSHGIYNSTIDWQEFLLGDFDLDDSPLGDFMTAFPTADSSKLGQINVYEVSQDYSAPNRLLHDDVVHFDLYDSIQSSTNLKAVFAPFSHDAEVSGTGGVTATVVPEPATLALLGTGLLGLASLARRRRQG